MSGPVLLDRFAQRRPEAGRASIVATLTQRPSASELAALDRVADELELRADLTGELGPRWLRSLFGGALTYSLPSTAGIDAAERHARLLAASERFDFVELDHERDLIAPLLERISPERRLIGWHGPARRGALDRAFQRMAAVPAGRYRLTVEATTVADGLAPLGLLRDLGRDDVTAFATGPAGGWTRLLAPHLGAPVAHAVVNEERGELTADVLRADFGYPELSAPRALYGIVGGSDRLSLAPRIVNTGFRAAGLPALYLPFHPSDFDSFWRQVVVSGLPGLGLPVRGLTVVRPHKEAALTVAAATGGRAERAGAANCLVRSERGWRAVNTSGLIDLLRDAGVEPLGLRAAVVGCGGAGRSIAADLGGHGATVTLVNRGEERGGMASRLLGLPWVPLRRFSPRGFDLVVNATPLVREAPFDPGLLDGGAVVADLAYLPDSQTALVAAAESRDLVVIDGHRVLAAETGSQFRLMTGQPLPAEAVRVALA